MKYVTVFHIVGEGGEKEYMSAGCEAADLQDATSWLTDNWPCILCENRELCASHPVCEKLRETNGRLVKVTVQEVL